MSIFCTEIFDSILGICNFFFLHFKDSWMQPDSLKGLQISRIFSTSFGSILVSWYLPFFPFHSVVVCYRLGMAWTDINLFLSGRDIVKVCVCCCTINSLLFFHLEPFNNNQPTASFINYHPSKSTINYITDSLYLYQLWPK